MILEFHKYQATGNDFVILDNRDGKLKLGVEEISKLCDRRFGVGADGLILIEHQDEKEFGVVYFNPDGTQSLCGNGCRAAIRFAESLQLAKGNTAFAAYDGDHQAKILGESIRLNMSDVQFGREVGNGIFLDTGSPHFVLFVDDVDSVDVIGIGRKWRYSEHFSEGANVNFVQLMDDHLIKVRTYERGVENETLSCGTGVTASALACDIKGLASPIAIETKGGNLKVGFTVGNEKYENVWLEGPAEHVFSGTITI